MIFSENRFALFRIMLWQATLYIYADDHAPPHFHMLGPNSSAQISIDTLRVIRGR